MGGRERRQKVQDLVHVATVEPPPPTREVKGVKGECELDDE